MINDSLNLDKCVNETGFKISYNAVPFIGRQLELSHLKTLLTESVEGNGKFVVVSGEAGIGKTALVHHFTASVKEEMDLVYISESLDYTKSYKPYAPFLRMVAKLGGSKLRKVVERVNRDLNGASANRTQFEEHNSNWDMETLYALQTERGLAQQFLVSTLIEASQRKPLLICLNDVHHAPGTTWQFIHYLASSIADKKIMIIVSLRRDGKIMNQAKMPVYAKSLQRMNREGLLENIILKRFGKEETKMFFRNIFLHTDFTAQFVPLVHDVSGGLPIQLVKLLRIMLENKIIFQHKDIWFNDADLNKEKLVKLMSKSCDLKDFSEKMDNLSETDNKILEYCALMESNFDHRVLASILKTEPVKILKKFEQFCDRKLFINNTDDSYCFRQSEIITLILGKMSKDRQVLLHNEIIEAVEEDEQLSSEQKTIMLSYHYGKTDEKLSAFRYHYRAGDLSVKNLAFLEALDYYRRAIDLIGHIPLKQMNDEPVELLIRTAWLNRNLGNWEESLKNCQLADRLLSDSSNQSLKTQINLQKAFTFYRQNNWEKAKLNFKKCLKAEGKSKIYHNALAHYGMGIIGFELCNYNLAISHFNKSLSLAQKLNFKVIEADVYNNLGAIENIQGSALRAISYYSESIPIFQELGNRAGLARIYHNIGMTYADDGNWEMANEFYSKSLTLSDELGLMPLKSITFLNRAMAFTNMNRLDEAGEYNIKAFRLLNLLNDELGIAEYHKIQGLIEKSKKRWEEATDNFQAAITKYNSVDNKLGQAETEYELALLAQELGDKPLMDTWYKKAKNSYQDLGLFRKLKKMEKQFQ